MKELKYCSRCYREISGEYYSTIDLGIDACYLCEVCTVRAVKLKVRCVWSNWRVERHNRRLMNKIRKRVKKAQEKERKRILLEQLREDFSVESQSRWHRVSKNRFVKFYITSKREIKRKQVRIPKKYRFGKYRVIDYRLYRVKEVYEVG